MKKGVKCKKPSAVSPDEFREIKRRLGLRHVDIAWLMGVSLNQSWMWGAGRARVPQSLRLLLLALGDGSITPGWLARNIPRPVPRGREDYDASRPWINPAVDQSDDARLIANKNSAI